MTQLEVPTELIAGEYLLQRYDATVADYERAANEDTRLELLDEVLIMHSPASVRHELIFSFLLGLMQGYVRAKDLGTVLGSRTPMYLENMRRFEPDLLFVSNAAMPRLGDTALRGAADLVIEILSPATREYDLGKKRDAYAAGGVGEYWMIDAANSRLMVDRPAGARRSELESGWYDTDAVAGFRLDVSWLWRNPPPDANACLKEIL